MAGPLDGASAEAVELWTDRLLLRPFVAGDVAELHAAVSANRDHLRSRLPWLAAATRVEDISKLVRAMQNAWARGTERQYAVIERRRSLLVGGAVLKDGEVGCWLGAEHLGRGYATEAVAALTWAAFSLFRRGSVRARVDADNVASAAVPARLGFARVDDTTWELRREDFAGAAIAGVVGPLDATPDEPEDVWDALWREAVAELGDELEITATTADSVTVRIRPSDSDGLTLEVRRAWAHDEPWLIVSVAVAPISDVSAVAAMTLNSKLAYGRLCFDKDACLLRHAEPLQSYRGRKPIARVVRALADAAEHASLALSPLVEDLEGAFAGYVS